MHFSNYLSDATAWYKRTFLAVPASSLSVLQEMFSLSTLIRSMAKTVILPSRPVPLRFASTTMNETLNDGSCNSAATQIELLIYSIFSRHNYSLVKSCIYQSCAYVRPWRALYI
jgi:hypothetical protein